MIAIAKLEAMAAAGCTAQDIISAIKEEAANETLLAKREQNRERQRRWYAKKHNLTQPNAEPNAPNVRLTLGQEKTEQNQQSPNANLTPSIKPALYIKEDRYVEAMQVREEVSKKERSDRENTRARKKPGTPFPEDCSQIIAALQKAGFAESLIIEQIDMMRDWALAGDNRKVDWVAFARNWLRKNNKPAQFGFNNATAKPLTFHQATQVHNARIIRETLFGTDQAEPQRPALGRSII